MTRPLDVTGPLIARADATREIGSGHLVRSVALAHAWKKAGGDAVVVTHAAEHVALPTSVERADMPVLRVPAPHPDPSDLAFMRTVLGGRRSAWVSCDGYHFDAGYTRALREANARVLVIDDIADAPLYEADAILNQNIFAERLSYGCASETRMLLGPEYALLRSEFEPWRPTGNRAGKQVERILITMGGGDPFNQTEKALRALEAIPGAEFQIRVIVGNNNHNRARLEAYAAKALPGRVGFVTNPPSMAAELASADLAISAGGSTCWELCFLGIPAVLITFADNQAGITGGLGEVGAAIHLGWYEQVTEQDIGRAVTVLRDDPDRRLALSRVAQRLVDGQGTSRVMRALRQPVEVKLCAS